MTDGEQTATMAARAMFFGALPCTLFSLLSYAANLLSCAGGLVYFGIGAWKDKILPQPRQWAAIIFSLGQAIAAPVYFMSI